MAELIKCDNCGKEEIKSGQRINSLFWRDQILQSSYNRSQTFDICSDICAFEILEKNLKRVAKGELDYRSFNIERGKEPVKTPIADYLASRGMLDPQD